MIGLHFTKQLRDFTLALDLSLPAGVTVLFGHSGSGKSMTLACLAGLAQPDQGTISIAGRPLYDSRRRLNLPPQRRRVGLVTQEYLLFPHLTVEENIAFGLTGGSRSEKRRIVREILHLVGLEGLESQRPQMLSGGQQQRVALARALVIEPEVLLLDEPFSALDGPTRARLRRDLLHIIHDELRSPVLFVTHDLAEAYLLAEHMVVLETGRVLQEGAPSTIVYNPTDRRVAALTGSQNFYEAEVLRHDTAGTVVRVGEVELLAPCTPLPTGSRVDITIRPERIMLVRKDAPKEPRENELYGRIVSELTDGLNHTLFFRLDDGNRLQERPYDFEILMPAYVHERLGLRQTKRWAVTVKREAISFLSPLPDPSRAPR